MKTSVVKQAISEDCLFRVIAEWCKAGAGRTNRQLHMLSAFASGAGIAALSPLFDVFLARGNCLNIICGIDRNGTDREAIRRLHGLLSTHHSGINVSILILTPTENNTMRRLEMPQIRDLPRNLAVLFVKLSGRRRFAYRVLPQGSGGLRTANSLLKKNGQQGTAERRYIIGIKDDELWQRIKKLLPT